LEVQRPPWSPTHRVLTHGLGLKEQTQEKPKLLKMTLSFVV